jgi:hypothetical protein
MPGVSYRPLLAHFSVQFNKVDFLSSSPAENTDEVTAYYQWMKK